MSEKKKVLLLAVSCKKGGLCPGGIDLDNTSEWIRIVRDDGQAGSVQGSHIDYAKPLDIIEFDGHPVPRGIQKENWAIDNNSCRKVGTISMDLLNKAYEHYGYHGFWDNTRSFLTQSEMDILAANSIPSESIMIVSNVMLYNNQYGKSKIDFTWYGRRLEGISMTDPDFYDALGAGQTLSFASAMIVVSIPSVADFVFDGCTAGRAYKFVSKLFVEC